MNSPRIRLGACLFSLFLSSLPVTPAVASGPDIVTLDTIATDLATGSEGRILLNRSSSCGSTGDGKCEKWIRKSGAANYLDTLDPSVTESSIQKLFHYDWNPEKSGGVSFLDFQEARFRAYGYRDEDRRYILPISRMKGWTGLDHPPVFELERPVSDYHPKLGGPLPTADHAFYSEAFQSRLDRITETELTLGNRVDLIENHDSYEKKLDLIRRAKTRLWVTSMVFYCDESSSELLDAMAERAHAGVDVRIIVEGLYGKTVYRSCMAKIKRLGIKLLPLTESVTRAALAKITHSKFWIRDGEEAIIGGQNILADENLSTGFNDRYRDTDAWIHAGPTITDLEGAFIKIWIQHRRDLDRAMDTAARENRLQRTEEVNRGVRGPKVLERLRDPALRSQGLCRVLSQLPGGKAHSIETALAEYLGKTSELAIITTPRMYFDSTTDLRTVPAGPIFLELIDAARRRGVRVDLLTNGSEGMGGATTSPFRAKAAEARDRGDTEKEAFWLNFADRLGRANSASSFRAADDFASQSDNIHVWNYFRYSHQKVHYFDRRLVGIGSFNLDRHSSRGNRETELFCFDDSLALQVEKMLTRDLVNSIPLRKVPTETNK